ncbi:SAF domain-containing protein [Sporosalibacterium faouarense]|uniref:SAF domain-containing protein n=1 Tax=Sporosalibacterium faouarense TaxID=516123 RepID=UPI00141D30C6|nr:SAF domain-containing protein [Sporosalibacterium faouarense]MTI48734.1 hypothetical protein [Bacillota bacterium]
MTSIKDKKIYFVIILFLMILSATIYFYENIRIPNSTTQTMLEVKKEVDINSMPKTSVAMMIGNKDIDKYTEISKEIIDTQMKLVEVPNDFVPKGAVTDLNMILGKICKEPLRAGEQLVLESFSEDEKWFGEFQRLKEFTIRSTVADTLESGNIIDVLVIYGNGDYDVVFPKVKIKKLSEKKADIETQEDDKVQIVIPVDEIGIRDLVAAEKLGELDVRIYLDESQSTSVKTFDFEKAKEQLKLTDNSDKSNIINRYSKEANKFKISN